MSTADLAQEDDDSGIWNEVAIQDPDWDVYQINPDTSEGGARCGSPQKHHSDAQRLHPISSINGKHKARLQSKINCQNRQILVSNSFREQLICRIPP